MTLYCHIQVALYARHDSHCIYKINCRVKQFIFGTKNTQRRRVPCRYSTGNAAVLRGTPVIPLHLRAAIYRVQRGVPLASVSRDNCYLQVHELVSLALQQAPALCRFFAPLSFVSLRHGGSPVMMLVHRHGAFQSSRRYTYRPSAGKWLAVQMTMSWRNEKCAHHVLDSGTR